MDYEEQFVEALRQRNNDPRITASQGDACALRFGENEFRAQAAEIEAREAKQALALVEEAIRRRLLYASSEAISSSNAIT
jgi:DNA-directed RNA polymerase subunit M/transcription elongation factor TFIIS